MSGRVWESITRRSREQSIGESREPHDWARASYGSWLRFSFQTSVGRTGARCLPRKAPGPPSMQGLLGPHAGVLMNLALLCSGAEPRG